MCTACISLFNYSSETGDLMDRFSYFSDPNLTSGTFPHVHFPLSVEKHPKAVVSHKLQPDEVQASLFCDRLQYLRRPMPQPYQRDGLKVKTNRQIV